MNIISEEILQFNGNVMGRNTERSVNSPLLNSDVSIFSESCLFQFNPLICQFSRKKKKWNHINKGKRIIS